MEIVVAYSKNIDVFQLLDLLLLIPLRLVMVPLRLVMVPLRLVMVPLRHLQHPAHVVYRHLLAELLIRLMITFAMDIPALETHVLRQLMVRMDFAI
jgi:ABC-type glycerol-3-phosphate transport system permease component